MRGTIAALLGAGMLGAALLPLPATAQGAPEARAQEATRAVRATGAALGEKRSAAAMTIKTQHYWREAMRRPLAQRFGPAPPALVDYLLLDNARQGFPNQPRAPARLAASFARDLAQAIEQLPAPLKRALNGKLAGVYLVHDLGGTGWTEEITDAAGKPVAGVIVLDAQVLEKQSANAWASWKENTPFKPDARWRLRARIEAASSDNRRQAIQYILLHEIGHVLAIGTRLHPAPELAPQEAAARGPYTFFPLSWTVSPGGRYISLDEPRFAARAQVVYYLGAQLDGARMEETYRQLAATNFPTLYAATSPYDDFAESFASYVHVEMMRKPWRIELLRDGKPVMSYEACWREPRCAAKRKLVEQVLGLRQ